MCAFLWNEAGRASFQWAGSVLVCSGVEILVYIRCHEMPVLMMTFLLLPKTAASKMAPKTVASMMAPKTLPTAVLKMPAAVHRSCHVCQNWGVFGVLRLLMGALYDSALHRTNENVLYEIHGIHCVVGPAELVEGVWDGGFGCHHGCRGTIEFFARNLVADDLLYAVAAPRNDAWDVGSVGVDEFQELELEVVLQEHADAM